MLVSHPSHAAAASAHTQPYDRASATRARRREGAETAAMLKQIARLAAMIAIAAACPQPDPQPKATGSAHHCQKHVSERRCATVNEAVRFYRTGRRRRRWQHHARCCLSAIRATRPPRLRTRCPDFNLCTARVHRRSASLTLPNLRASLRHGARDRPAPPPVWRAAPSAARLRQLR